MQSLTQHKTITNCDENALSTLKRIYFMFVIALQNTHNSALLPENTQYKQKPNSSTALTGGSDSEK